MGESEHPLSTGTLLLPGQDRRLAVPAGDVKTLARIVGRANAQPNPSLELKLDELAAGGDVDLTVDEAQTLDLALRILDRGSERLPTAMQDLARALRAAIGDAQYRPRIPPPRRR